MHPTHYGRMCPIETPEGPNIGLIGSLSSYAQVSEHGFVTTPYRVVKDGKITEEIVHLDATEEQERLIAQANEPLDENGRLHGRQHPLPHAGGPVRLRRADRGRPDRRLAGADLVGRDGDDPVPGARRRQPRADGLQHAAPGRAAAEDRRPAGRHRHGAPRGARHGRRAAGAQRRRRSTSSTPPGSSSTPRTVARDEYDLQKYMRSNQGTLIHQKPFIKAGQRSSEGQLLADGSSSDKGEMALGKNLMVAFMSWEGYNFEDAIILSPAPRQGRRADLDPHRGVRGRRPHDQAGRRGDHARHPEPLGGVAAQPRRPRDRAHRRRGAVRAICWWARSRRRARPS